MLSTLSALKWRMAFGAAKNKALAKMPLSGTNDVKSIANGDRRRVEIGLYASVIFVDPGVLYSNSFLFFSSYRRNVFLSSTLSNRSFSIWTVCTVMPISVIGLGIVFGVSKFQINKSQQNEGSTHTKQASLQQ